MDAKTIEWIIFGPLILFLFIAGWWSVGESHRRLDDPNDDRTLHLEELPGKLALFAHGVYRVTIFRQSGYVHAEELVTGSAQQALARAMATFRRAGIMAVHVGANSETELIIGRLYHDHRGRNEGKKVGRAHISLVEQAARPVRIPEPPAVTPKITIEPIDVTCDCGTAIKVAYEEITAKRSCQACGRDITPTQLQLARIAEAAEDAKAEAMSRYRAGEMDILVSRNARISGNKT
jgi:hypothetical protein